MIDPRARRVRCVVCGAVQELPATYPVTLAPPPCPHCSVKDTPDDPPTVP